MVNAKHVAFKVNKQTPFLQTPDQAYATIIHCQPSTIQFEQREVRTHHVPLTNIGATSLKRKRGGAEGKTDTNPSANTSANSVVPSVSHTAVVQPRTTTTITPTPTPTARRLLLSQHWQQRKPTRFRKGKTLSIDVDLDCWFTILSFSDPVQLLEMRSKIALCYRFLRDSPMLWKHSRDYHYRDLPDPSSDLTEFQFAHLRHGHGCMTCGAPNTRKTYWAFLRRMCKQCLTTKVVKEYEAFSLFKDANGEDISFLHSCLASGIFDSWGNFVGVGPASTHALKTVYLLSDVQKLVAEYITETAARVGNPDEMRSWFASWHAAKLRKVGERQSFAKKMELWEETTRSSKSFEYQSKKAARKAYFQLKASELKPPLSSKELEGCPSYKRAVAIPKEPNTTSWDLLKPKLIKEAADFAAKERAREDAHPPTTSDLSTLASGSNEGQPPHVHPYLGMTLGLPSHYNYLA